MWKIDWNESVPPTARWSLSSCMARFLEGNAAGVCAVLILCINQSAVSLGWFWGMARSCLITSGFDLVANRYRCWERGFGLSVQVVPRRSPALPIWLRTVRGLRWPCTYERRCVFISACECGTHVYSTVPVIVVVTMIIFDGSLRWGLPAMGTASSCAYRRAVLGGRAM